MKPLFLLLLCITEISAHMPIFGDNLHIDDTQSKSWGVYISVEESYSLTMNVAAGKNISFSVSVPDTYEKQPNLTVTLFGHGASDIECDPDFNGWATEPEWKNNGRRLDRRLDAALDSTKDLVVHKTTEKVFEPFGTAGYRPIVACQGTAIIGDDLFRLTIVNHDEEALPLSIGVGMAESFGFIDLLFMSFTIMQSWLWAGKIWSLIIPIAAVLWYILVAIDKAPIEITYPEITGLKKEYIGTLEKLIHLCGLFMIVNSLQFFIQILFTAFQDVPMDLIWFPLIVHVIMPIVAYIALSYYVGIDFRGSGGQLKHYGFGVLFIGYTYALLWQSYCLSLLSFLGFFVLKVYYKSPYQELPTSN
jgi:hypothetical protein